MPISGMIMSGCWQTPAITMRAWRGASIIAMLMRPGAPTHSKMMSGPCPAIFSTCGVSGWLGSMASVAPNFAAIFAALFGFLADDDMARAEEFRPEHRGKSHRPRADHQHGCAARHARFVDGVQSDRQRLDHRAFAERHAFRQAVSAAGADAHIFGISAGALAETDAEPLPHIALLPEKFMHGECSPQQM